LSLILAPRSSKLPANSQEAAQQLFRGLKAMGYLLEDTAEEGELYTVNK